MSGQPVSADTGHPPHGHPENTGPSTQSGDKASTSSHPPPFKPDPTTTDSSASQGHLKPPKSSSSSTTVANMGLKLKQALRQYPDFPSPGILFEDILPIFSDVELHETLIQALELHIKDKHGEGQKPDVIVGLDARGFLFGPTLALRLGASFVPVRKQGKLPGETETAMYQKEYGQDHFQIQKDAIKPGQKVIIVDDIIATGGSAQAAGTLVKKLGGNLVEYIFMMELDFLKGRDKLDAPVFTLLKGQEEKK